MDDLARAVAWLRFSVWVHGVCNQDRSWSNDVWDRDLVPSPGSCVLKLTANGFRPTPGRSGYQHGAHCRLLVSDAASVMRGMNKPCIPFCGVQGGLSRVHVSHTMMQVADSLRFFGVPSVVLLAPSRQSCCLPRVKGLPLSGVNTSGVSWKVVSCPKWPQWKIECGSGCLGRPTRVLKRLTGVG